MLVFGAERGWWNVRLGRVLMCFVDAVFSTRLAAVSRTLDNCFFPLKEELYIFRVGWLKKDSGIYLAGLSVKSDSFCPTLKRAGICTKF